jgi:chromosome segregation ATPase
VPTPPTADDAERRDRLVQERDAARAVCGRLREEAEVLRSEMAKHLAEVKRLRTTAEEVNELRSDCDRLNAERDMMGREASQLQARLVEHQLTLVETEADLDDCRDRARAERLESQERCQGIVAEGERRLAEQRGDFEVERQAWREQVAIHRKVEHEAEALQAKVKKLRGLYDETRRERDEARQQNETLGRRCALLSTYLYEAEAERLAADQGHQAEIDRLTSALTEALEAAESAQRSDALHADQVRKLQAELAQHEHELSLFLQPQLPGEDPE